MILFIGFECIVQNMNRKLNDDYRNNFIEFLCNTPLYDMTYTSKSRSNCKNNYLKRLRQS